MANSRKQELAVGALLAVALVVVAVLAVKVGAVRSLGPTTDLVVRSRDAAGIAAGASVSIFGVEVGRVEGIDLSHEGAMIRLAVRADAPLSEGIAVRIRQRSVLGEKYVEIEPPATPGAAIASGTVLDIDHGQTEIDEIVQQFSPLLDAVDADSLRAMLVPVFGRMKEDPEALSRFFDDLQRLAHNAAEASDRLPALAEKADGLFTDADVLVERLSARAEEAKAPLRRADKLLADAESADLPGLAVDAKAAIGDARTALGDARVMVADVRKIVGDLDGVGADLKTILANFREIDKWELRRLLREEGILVRLKPDEVVPSASRTEDVVPPKGRHP